MADEDDQPGLGHHVLHSLPRFILEGEIADGQPSAPRPR